MITNDRSELQKELTNKETLLWIGKPKQGFILRQSDIVFIPFAIFCFLFLAYFIYKLLEGDMLFIILFSPSIIFLFILLGARFIMDGKRRAKTLYGLTENRVIIISGIFSKRVKSININKLEALELYEKDDKSGTVFLDPNDSATAWNEGAMWWFGRKVTPKLESIPEVRKIYNRLIEMQNA